MEWPECNDYLSSGGLPHPVQLQTVMLPQQLLHMLRTLLQLLAVAWGLEASCSSNDIRSHKITELS